MPIPEPEHRNNAGRLLSILSAIPNSQAYFEVLPKLFELPSTSEHEKQQSTMVALHEINQLYTGLREDLENSTMNDRQRDLLLSGLRGIESIIYPLNLAQGFRALTEAERVVLGMAAVSLAEEERLDESDLEMIRQSITELREQVEHAEISPALRKVLLELIRLAEDAIARFNIRGARGLRAAFKAMLGEVGAFYASQTPANQEELKKSAARAKGIKLLSVIDLAASKLLKYQPLIAGAAKATPRWTSIFVIDFRNRPPKDFDAIRKWRGLDPFSIAVCERPPAAVVF